LSNTNNRTLPSSAAATLSATFAGLLGDAQHCGHRVWYCCRICDSGQVEKPDTVWELIGQTRGDLGREASLADPAHPGQRDQPMRLHRVLQLGGLGLPPDEARGLRPQIPRRHIDCPQRRKVRAQALRSLLEHTDRNRHIAQPSRPQIEKIRSAEQNCR
jgi:hypothetical protein